MVVFPHNFPQARWSGLERPSVGSSISGLTSTSEGGHLLVHDSKAPGETRLSSVNGNSGAVEQVQVDWSRTDEPEDLEAVAYVDGRSGNYLAVEGSQYNGRTPHLFLFNYADGKGESLQRFDLPKLPYEIEGMVTRQRSDGDVLVMLGGRGDEIHAEGRLHWGVYDPQARTMEWPEEGVRGVDVRMPEHLGASERPIADLHLDARGDLWASGCVDEGDKGPFESLIYRVGQLDAEASNPVTLTLDRSTRVPGEKVEALSVNASDPERFLIGTDNESYGGTLQSLLRHP